MSTSIWPDVEREPFYILAGIAGKMKALGAEFSRLSDSILPLAYALEQESKERRLQIAAGNLAREMGPKRRPKPRRKAPTKKGGRS
jgi:hypothetical protein